MTTAPDFDSINTHVHGLNLDNYRAGGPHYFDASLVSSDPGSVLTRVCLIYHGVRPILLGLAGIPFIPKKWREALGVFMGLLDQLCMTPETPTT